jgi:hypothetical protein
MTPAELDAIEARAKAATPGPWENSKTGRVYRVDRPLNGRDFYEDGDLQFLAQFTTPGKLPFDDGDFDDPLTADFIAHARDDVPALVAEVRALEAHIERLEKRLRFANVRRREHFILAAKNRARAKRLDELLQESRARAERAEAEVNDRFARHNNDATYWRVEAKSTRNNVLEEVKQHLIINHVPTKYRVAILGGAVVKDCDLLDDLENLKSGLKTLVEP